MCGALPRCDPDAGFRRDEQHLHEHQITQTQLFAQFLPLDARRSAINSHTAELIRSSERTGCETPASCKICYVLGVKFESEAETTSSRIPLLVPLRWLPILSLVCASAYPSPRRNTWSLAQDRDFQIYSQAGAESARSALQQFEQLRTFFLRNGLVGAQLKSSSRPPVRVIGFRSEKEYDAFRLRATADAFYVGTEHRDYIVMPALTPRVFRLAAHEYAHTVLHSGGLALPPWLNEGLAEFFSTIRFTLKECQFGAAPPAHLETLRHHAWTPLAQLLTTDKKSLAMKSRDQLATFYAESWALTHMLVSSPDYAPHFHSLIAALNSCDPSLHALAAVYSKSLDSIAKDLSVWCRQPEFGPMTVRAGSAPELATQSSDLSDTQTDELMAEVLLAEGKLDRAEALYSDLAGHTPQNPNVLVALGTIALRRGDRKLAEQRWKDAIENGATDSDLLYRYACLGEENGLSQNEIRRTLERAVSLNPDFDDARYKLALLEGNAGNYQAALDQLRLLRRPSPQRAFGYWSATANALTELGHRDEAKIAARKALESAQTASERSIASELAYVAATDLTVQFAEDANGQERLITTRVPHGASDFNPFIDPKDHIRRSEGTLRECQCGGGKLTGFVVEASDGLLTLTVPDPLHVLMRNGPAEFTCGPLPARRVQVEYAAAAASSRTQGGILRGMEFR